MKKAILLVTVFLLTISFLYIGFNEAPIAPQGKYDLDYVGDFPKNDLKINEKDGSLSIHGIEFPKNFYRILVDDKENKVLKIQFVNPDSNDADYIIVVKNDEIIRNGDKIKYKDRLYKKNVDIRILTTTNDYTMLQMLQPPPISGLKFKYDLKINFSEAVAILQIVTILIAVMLYLTESEREKTIARREIYQKLELASINLFKLEVEKKDVIFKLYSDHKDILQKDTEDFFAVNAYVCSIMTLFEMIIEFKKDKIVDTQIFLSWARWFWDTATAANFNKVWEEIKMNYVGSLRETIDAGLKYAEDNKEYNDFMVGFIAERFKCEKDVNLFLK